MFNDIYNLLNGLGVTANYTGFSQMACAVSLSLEQPERLMLVTKWLYPEVAKRCGTNWKSVERNIRTVGDIIWRENRPLLEQLACRPLVQKPRSAQLLAIICASSDSSLSVDGLGKAVAFTGKDDDIRVVNEPVNEGGCKAVISKDSIPFPARGTPHP